MPWRFPLVVLGLSLLLGCSGEPLDEDGIDDAFAAPGKADDAWGECQVRQVLAWVNAPSTSAAVLKTIGLTSRPSRNIVSHRDGPDKLPTTADDDLFDTIEELDAVPYVGPKAMEKLVASVAERCQTAPAPEVVFSPQTYDRSHLAKLAIWLQGAERSIDVAMYSFSDTGTLNALDAAVRRGVKVRMVFEPASADRAAPAGTWSSKLEDRGVDVRYVNKIMHHKFALIDGPRDALEQAHGARLVTGSANWSNSAATRYDENTTFIEGDAELNLRFQQEFNLLWEYSREFTWNPALLMERSLPILDAYIPDDPSVDAVFTSDNFRATNLAAGPGFSLITGKNTVADRLVALIEQARTSIHLASGHLRSRPVAMALMAKQAERPDMDIRVYLDNQEYISAWYDSQQQADLEACVVAADDSASKLQACYDRGYYYSYPVQAAGIPLRFKTYCYRWSASYAKQMHHKYIVFDGRVVASGSYNLSDNAEHGTLENMVIYDASRFPDLVEAFEDNFERIWVTGEAEGRYAALLEEIQTGTGPLPIVFEPMALTHEQVTTLKDEIREHCPAVNSDPYRLEPEKHLTCER